MERNSPKRQTTIRREGRHNPIRYLIPWSL